MVEEEETNWKVKMSFAHLKWTDQPFSPPLCTLLGLSLKLFYFSQQKHIQFGCSALSFTFYLLRLVFCTLCSVQLLLCTASNPPGFPHAPKSVCHLTSIPASRHCCFFFFTFIYLSISSGVEIESLVVLRINSGGCFFYPPHSKIHYVTSKLCDVKTMIFQLNLHIQHVGSVAGRHLWPVSKDFVDVGMKSIRFLCTFSRYNDYRVHIVSCEYSPSDHSGHYTRTPGWQSHPEGQIQSEQHDECFFFFSS